MSEVALFLRGQRRNALVVGRWVGAFIAVAIIVLVIVTSITRFHRGIYGGFHYGDARTVAINALIVKYGWTQADKMRFAVPPVVNTHSSSLLIHGQIRVFHVIGPHGVKYCVKVWRPGPAWTGQNNSGINIGGDTQIIKFCSFR